MTRYHFVLMLSVAVPLGLPTPASAEVRYTIRDIRTADGICSSAAYAINETGQVVGDLGGVAYLWDDGVMTFLPPQQQSRAFDISNSTRIVGELWGGWIQAALWEDGQISTLGTFGGPAASARGINEAGQVAGWADTPDRYDRAFLYSGGALTDLGTFGGQQSWAFGINNAGQVVGKAETDVTPPGGLPIRRAFLYSNGVMMPIAGDGSEARDINDMGQIVGTDVVGAFLWENGVLTSLGTLGGFSDARAINNSGQVVGMSFPGLSPRAFLWEDGLMRDLNDLIPTDAGWETLEWAQDVNDLGQIVGWGRLDTGEACGFVLTPIPEPGAFVILGLGGLCCSRERRRGQADEPADTRGAVI